jgi:predicted Zn-dependent protease
MAHVIRGHAMDRIIRNSAIATASRTIPVRGFLAGWLRNVGVQFLESAYCRELESEADELGVRLVASAGYDAHAGVRFLRRLEEKKSSAGQFKLGRYFSSHPPFKVRIDDMKCLLQHSGIQAL